MLKSIPGSSFSIFRRISSGISSSSLFGGSAVFGFYEKGKYDDKNQINFDDNRRMMVDQQRKIKIMVGQQSSIKLLVRFTFIRKIKKDGLTN